MTDAAAKNLSKSIKAKYCFSDALFILKFCLYDTINFWARFAHQRLPTDNTNIRLQEGIAIILSVWKIKSARLSPVAVRQTQFHW